MAHSPRLVAATADTLELVRAHNRAKKSTFLLSSNYIHADTAKLGYVLSSVLAQATGSAGDFRTFFVNSSLEAFSGAIKLARQTSVRHGKDDGGWLLILDEESRFQPFFDPTGKGSEHGMTPHLCWVRDLGAAASEASKRTFSAFIYVRSNGKASEASQVAAVAQRVRARGGLLVSCDSELDLDDATLFSHPFRPDVVVYGENLTGRQLPFGCFTMTQEAHAVWNNDVDCFAQTSTFGGNRVCAAGALSALQRAGRIQPAQQAVCRKIDATFTTTVEYWGRFVNPGMAALASVFGMDMDVKEAFGGRLRMADGREVIDCSGGFGCNLRGYNHPDVLSLLTKHDPRHDYFADLEAFLCARTSFAHAFPAVSGATAVDVAASLAMLANPSRTKVVTFTGNFGGKTLFALNFSKHGPQLTESDQDAFRPYYRELVYVDPFAPDAESQLRALLEAGDVALVWFEMLRGGMCELLPERILALVGELKQKCGYLIGVDEVLTGGFRSGKSYLLHQASVPGCDVVSVGKTLSDMTVPMAAVLVTEQVYARARASDPVHVERLQQNYRFGLGAHIALNAFEDVFGEARRAAMLRSQSIIEEGLRELVRSSPLFSELRGKGTLLLLVMNPKYFPFHHRSKSGNLLEMALSHLIFVRTGVFVFLLRFLHRVAADEGDARELVRRLHEGLRDVTPLMVYRYAASRILGRSSVRLGKLLAGDIGTMPAKLTGSLELRDEPPLRRPSDNVSPPATAREVAE